MIHDSFDSAFMTHERRSSWWTCFSPLIKKSQLFKNCNMHFQVGDTWGNWAPHGDLGPLFHRGQGGGDPMPLSIRIPNLYQVPCYCWASLPYIPFFVLLLYSVFVIKAQQSFCFRFSGQLCTTCYCKKYSRFPICCIHYYQNCGQ